ncbi:MAG: PHP domain-containing protein, partial [Myxococcales bacterium]|nr:PHP domain-containing protein [Myxococcales bacterium]
MLFASSRLRHLLPWTALSICLVMVLPACTQDEPNLLRAKRAESRYELVGGPVAYGDVGDYVLENDKLRAAILDTNRSWGPGVYGGSLVDLDVRRKDGRFPPGTGRDRFAEIFPLANLLNPAPLDSQISVLKDGSDGKEATIRVAGSGYAMLHSLYVIRDNKELLESVLGLKDVKANVRFITDYTVRPGESFVRMKTKIILTGKPGSLGTCTSKKKCDEGLTCVYPDDKNPVGDCFCKDISKSCTLECEALQRDKRGCDVCACSKTLQMSPVKDDVGVISVIMGDSPIVSKSTENAGGMGAGDFVFFGKHNKQFVPGHGFDQQQDVWEAWFKGRDTFAKPFLFNYVAAVGGDVSYAYYTVKKNPDDPEPQVAVPVFTSTATPFISAATQCKQADTDDADCDSHRVYEYERFLAVGRGDAASVVGEIYKHRGTKVGTVKGYVRWTDSGAPAKNAHVFAISDPEPGRKWKSIDELVAANRKATGSPGVVSAIDADAGMDVVEDGDFEATLPVGSYQLVAKDHDGIVFGPLIGLTVKEGAKHIVLPSLPTPARIRVNTTDGHGKKLPAKATIVALDANGKRMERDAHRRVYLGQGRLGTGVQHIAFDENGTFDLPVAAGRYRLVVSHGTEYSVHTEQDFTIAHGQEMTVSATLKHELDTTGWISGDFHLHQKPSFDSGMDLDHRVRTIVAEGVDYVAATDHDVVTDFKPWIQMLGLDTWVKSVVGVEISTLDIGHYIGFPFKYKELDVPSHGSVDWYCMTSNTLVDTMVFERSGFTKDEGERPTTIIAHPRDGFLGWADAIGLNPFTLTRNRNETDADREKDSQVFRTVTCDFDAMEVFNAKRFDLVRTPSVREIQVFERCLIRIDTAGVNDKAGTVDEAVARAALPKACPELGMLPELSQTPELMGKKVDIDGVTHWDLATCDANERLFDCKHRYRTALSVAVNTAILVRTKAEQDAWYVELSRTPDEVKKWRPDAGGPADAVKAQSMLDAVTALCRVDRSKLDKNLADLVAAEDLVRPCAERNGVLEDYFRFLEHGLVKAIIGGSDSHASSLEPGLPRTYIRSATDKPLAIDVAEISKNMRKSQVMTSYGAFLSVAIGDKQPGDTVAAKAGSKVKVKVNVQTASWYGIDLIEIYMNGRL